MKTWSQFKSQLVSEAVIPKNHGYGFMGTAKDPHKMLDQAVAHIKKAAKTVPHFKMSDETIGHYLDSVGGRHLADHMNYNSHPDEIHKSVSRSIKEFSKTYNPNMFESFNDAGEETLEESKSEDIAKTRRLKAEIAKHEATRVAAQEAHGNATRELHAHRMATDKKYAESHKKRAAKHSSEHWYEPGRDRTPNHAGSIHESDPHLSAVHAAAMSTAGRAAAAKRLAANAKAREEYLAKKAGKSPTAEPKMMPTPKPAEEQKKHGILHSNQAKAMEHWSKVRKILDKPLPAKTASEKLAPHTDDQRLHADLHHFAKANPDVDMRPLVKKHLERIRKTG